jgi:hypothetical protein
VKTTESQSSGPGTAAANPSAGTETNAFNLQNDLAKSNVDTSAANYAASEALSSYTTTEHNNMNTEMDMHDTRGVDGDEDHYDPSVGIREDG